MEESHKRDDFVDDGNAGGVDDEDDHDGDDHDEPSNHYGNDQKIADDVDQTRDNDNDNDDNYNEGDDYEDDVGEGDNNDDDDNDDDDNDDDDNDDDAIEGKQLRQSRVGQRERPTQNSLRWELSKMIILR